MTAVAVTGFGGGSMRIRLAHLIELIVGLAIGMGFARLDYTDGVVHREPILALINDLLMDVLAGLAVVSGIGLGIESIRSRGRGGPWGIGRWAWALSSLSFVVGGVGKAITLPIWGYTTNNFPSMDFILIVIFQYAVASSTSDFIGFLGVFWLTVLLARLPRDTAPDYREWSGRILGGFLLVWGPVVYVHSLVYAEAWKIF